MRTLIALALALALGAPVALAGDITSEWAGVYKSRSENAMADGERYESEDVLEIVRLDADSAYVRTRLEFYNAHFCASWFVARVEGDALVYREPNPPAHRGQCVLTLRREGEVMRFGDESGMCARHSCGARGGYNRQALPVSSQRRIRYMARLLASREYAEAMAEAGRTP